MLLKSFCANSWCRLPADPEVIAWARHALPVAVQTRFDEAQEGWLRCGGTWFAGVNALPNNARGALAAGPALTGSPVEFLRRDLSISSLEFEPAQVSICYPGYPQPMAAETAAAFGYRRDRCAAHIDGILPEGSLRRRHLREHHQFVLGVPLTRYDDGCSPPVVWEGSHEIVRQTLRECYTGLPDDQWGDVDITDTYKTLRNKIFDECRPVEIVAEPGEAFVLHRLALHGIAPWRSTEASDPAGRIICYFRPETASPHEWLNSP